MPRTPQGAAPGHPAAQPGKVWTLAEANEALPLARGLMEDARAHLNRIRQAEDQLLDLRTLHGDGVLAAAHTAHGEWEDWTRQRAEAISSLDGVLARFRDMGAEPKDVDQGLVDFRGRLGDQAAYLCWRYGEERIEWWHPLEGGFAGRRRIPLPGAPADE